MPCSGRSASPGARNGERKNWSKQPWRNGKSGSPSRRNWESWSSLSKDTEKAIAEAVAKAVAKSNQSNRHAGAQDRNGSARGWVCPGCDFRNWAKRTECKECGCPKDACRTPSPSIAATESAKSDATMSVDSGKGVMLQEPTDQEQDLETQIADTAALVSWMAGRESMQSQRQAAQEKLNQLKGQLSQLKPTAVRLQMATAKLRQQQKAHSTAQDRLEEATKELAAARLAVAATEAGQAKAEQEVNQLSVQLATEGAGSKPPVEHPAQEVMKKWVEILQSANNPETSIQAVAAMRMLVGSVQKAAEQPDLGLPVEPSTPLSQEAQAAAAAAAAAEKAARDLVRHERERSPRRSLERNTSQP